MKNLFIATVLLVGFNAHAQHGWTEQVDCTLERYSVDTGKVATEATVAELYMSGRHNGETGEVSFKGKLTPSYTFTFSKFSGGRNEEAYLQTKLQGQVVALSSVDTQFERQISNRFLTKNGDFQIRITCVSEMSETKQSEQAGYKTITGVFARRATCVKTGYALETKERGVVCVGFDSQAFTEKDLILGLKYSLKGYETEDGFFITGLAN